MKTKDEYLEEVKSKVLANLTLGSTSGKPSINSIVSQLIQDLKKHPHTSDPTIISIIKSFQIKKRLRTKEQIIDLLDRLF